jgi:CRISPR/Cas system-associated exonuclease Cas4 (RecB family)
MISQSKIQLKHFSYTSLSTYLYCPRLWYYRYVMKPEVSVRARMLLGRCYHEIVAQAALQHQLFNEKLDARQITRLFSRRWDQEVEERQIYDDPADIKTKAADVDFDGEDPRELKKAGLALAIRFIMETLPTLDIDFVEKRMEANIDGIPFLGYIDMGLKNGDIIDHKLRTDKMNQDKTDRDLQPTSYALLLDRPITFHFYQALDQKKEKKIEPITTKRSMEEVGMLRQIIRDCWNAIHAGHFFQNPTSWLCGSRCSYYLDCLHPNF